jgi:ribosome-binding factor A
MSISIERLASLIQRELANIVNEEVKNSQVGYVNLTEVKVTKDLSYATIFYTVLSDDADIIKKAQELLEKHTSKIRKRLAEKIRNVRKIPELLFKYDEALAYGNHIDQLLKTIQ